MNVIYTCPICGADLINYCITTYPEKAGKMCPACGWNWVDEREDDMRVPFVPPERSNWSDIPSCCKHCSNHPSNGGSGICNCTAPYYSDGGWRVTC